MTGREWALMAQGFRLCAKAADACALIAGAGHQTEEFVEPLREALAALTGVFEAVDRRPER